MRIFGIHLKQLKCSYSLKCICPSYFLVINAYTFSLFFKTNLYKNYFIYKQLKVLDYFSYQSD